VKTALSSAVAVAGAILGAIGAGAQAVEPPAWETSAADFAKVCVTSLLASAELPNALSERGLSAQRVPPFAPAGWDGDIYAAADGRRGVTVTRQVYSDLRISICTTVALKSASHSDLEALRAQIESDPRVGKLEGRMLAATPTARIATLKRPGNRPIITFNFTSSATATSLSMSRFDLQPGH